MFVVIFFTNGNIINIEPVVLRTTTAREILLTKVTRVKAINSKNKWKNCTSLAIIEISASIIVEEALTKTKKLFGVMPVP